MGNRLTKIYTRTGDDGTTGLGTGERVGKDCPRVEAYGTVDELNSYVGLVLATPNLPRLIHDSLTAIQHRLFDLGGELAVPGRDVIIADDSIDLETVLDTLNEDLPPLKDFVLPGGTPGASACHLARAVCRRAAEHCTSRGVDIAQLALQFSLRNADLATEIADGHTLRRLL